MTNEITRETLRSLTIEDIASMNKTTLSDHLIAAVQFLNAPPERTPGRKDDVLAMLQQGPATILEIANALNITTKNVSSQLSYLRKEGWVLHTDEKSRKYLAQDTPNAPEEAPEVTEESAE